ncbi:hypothetical protein BJ166DRAFT_492711 [Pestalotiopsis sp. NC0098]|nr:hypothetical protein BJ166DRAFT_492711 [Pestalotiopsis sp. NC0098]
MGWTPIFYLLEDHTAKNDMNHICATTSFFSILSSDSLFLDLEYVGSNDMTILQRVACFGSGEDIQMLLDLQAEMSINSKHPWEDPRCALSYAITEDNPSAFVTLVECVPDLDYVSETDGYSILHYAARLGRPEMVRYLLEVKDMEEFVPDFDPESDSAIAVQADLDDDDLTPWVQETYDSYMQVLEGLGRIVIKDNDSGSGRGRDIFWDCNETWKFD